MSAKKVNNSVKEIFIFTLLLIILVLTAININNYLKPKQIKILGAETKNDNDTEKTFWQNLLTKNPNYIPGWIEIGQENKAYEIDPNYLKP
jgi:hypothetical protein